jgi:hypothetical protein
MKFLKEDGTIEEGVLLSDLQVEQRQQIEDFLHEKVCRDSFHSTYGSKAKCAEVANQLIANLDYLVVAGLTRVIDALTPKPEPEPILAVPVPEPVIDLAVHAAEIVEEAF